MWVKRLEKGWERDVNYNLQANIKGATGAGTRKEKKIV